MTKRLPEYLKGPAHYRRTVRNVRPPRMTLVGADDPDRGRTDEAPRRSITLPRVQFLERPGRQRGEAAATCDRRGD